MPNNNHLRTKFGAALAILGLITLACPAFACDDHLKGLLTSVLSFKYPPALVNSAWLGDGNFECPGFAEAGLTKVRRDDFLKLSKNPEASQILSHFGLNSDQQVDQVSLKRDLDRLIAIGVDPNSSAVQPLVKSVRDAIAAADEINQPEACVDKRIEVGPVRDQENLWCLAMVSADILSNASGQFLSVADLVLQRNLLRNSFETLPELPVAQPLFQGGYAPFFEPFLSIGVKGLCLEENFKSGFVGSGRHSTYILKDFFIQSSAGQISDSVLSEMKMVFSGVKNASSFTAPYNLMTLSLIADQSCYPRVKTTGYDVIEKSRTDYLSERGLVTAIDDVLNSGRIVGISLVADTIGTGLPISNLEQHAVSIVGKRFGPQSKKCEYIIRNSFGTSWGDGGYKSIPRDYLLSGVDKITFLKPAGTH